MSSTAPSPAEGRHPASSSRNTAVETDVVEQQEPPFDGNAALLNASTDSPHDGEEAPMHFGDVADDSDEEEMVIAADNDDSETVRRRRQGDDIKSDGGRQTPKYEMHFSAASNSTHQKKGDNNDCEQKEQQPSSQHEASQLSSSQHSRNTMELQWSVLQYDDPIVEAAFRKFLYRGRRAVLGFISGFTCLACVVTVVSSTSSAVQWLAAYMFSLAGVSLAICVTYVALFSLNRKRRRTCLRSRSSPEEEPVSVDRSHEAALPSTSHDMVALRSTEKAIWYERLCVVLIAVAVGISLFFYPQVYTCIVEDAYYNPYFSVCADFIPSACVAMQVMIGVLLPCRCIWTIPSVILCFIANFLLRPTATVDTPAALVLKILVTFSITLFIAIVAYLEEMSTRRMFEQTLHLVRKSDTALVRRDQLDKALEALLPKSVLSRVATGKPVIDHVELCVIGVGEVFDYVKWSSTLLPGEMAQTFNSLYSAFDEATARYGVDKTKAVGDKYIVTCGLQQPLPELTSATRVVVLSLLQVKVLNELNKITRESPLSFRNIAHAGPVTGAIVGRHSLSYDVYGEGIDTAMKLLALVPPTTVYASDPVFALVRGYFAFAEPDDSGREAASVAGVHLRAVRGIRSEARPTVVQLTSVTPTLPGKESQQQSDNDEDPLTSLLAHSNMLKKNKGALAAVSAGSSAAKASARAKNRWFQQFLSQHRNLRKLNEALERNGARFGELSDGNEYDDDDDAQKATTRPPRLRSGSTQGAHDDEDDDTSSPSSDDDATNRTSYQSPHSSSVAVTIAHDGSAAPPESTHQDKPDGEFKQAYEYQEVRYEYLMKFVRKRARRTEHVGGIGRAAEEILDPSNTQRKHSISSSRGDDFLSASHRSFTSLEAADMRVLSRAVGAITCRKHTEYHDNQQFLQTALPRNPASILGAGSSARSESSGGKGQLAPVVHINDDVVGVDSVVGEAQLFRVATNPLILTEANFGGSARDGMHSTSSTNDPLSSGRSSQKHRSAQVRSAAAVDQQQVTSTPLPLYGRRYLDAVAELLHSSKSRSVLATTYVDREVEDAFQHVLVATRRSKVQVMFALYFMLMLVVLAGSFVDISSITGRGTIEWSSGESGRYRIENAFNNWGIAFLLLNAALCLVCSVVTKRGDGLTGKGSGVWGNSPPYFLTVVVAVVMLLGEAGVACFPPGIMNSDHNYLLLIHFLLIITTAPRWSHAVLLVLLDGLFAFGGLFTSIGHIYGYMLPLLFVAGGSMTIFSCYHLEQHERQRFEAVSLNSAVLQATEEEASLLRVVQEMMFPPHVADAVMDACLSHDPTKQRLFLQHYGELCTVELRVDRLFPPSTSAAHQNSCTSMLGGSAGTFPWRPQGSLLGSSTGGVMNSSFGNIAGSGIVIGGSAALEAAERALFLVESLVQRANSVYTQMFIDDAYGGNYELNHQHSVEDEADLIAKVHSFGDTVLFAGPFASKRHSGSRRTSNSRTRAQQSTLTIRRRLRADGDQQAVSPQPSSRKPMMRLDEKQLHELRHHWSSRAILRILSEIVEAHKSGHSMVSLTAIACSGSAFGTLLGSRRVSFNLLGHVTRQSSSLVAASSAAFVGCSEAFRRVVSDSKTVLPLPGSQVDFGESVRWRVRGVGAVSVFPLVIPAQPPEVLFGV